jgi:hypothetical protein
MRILTTALALSIAAPALLAAPALADGEGTREVAVITIAKDTKVHAEIVHDIVAAFKRDRNFVLKDLHAVLNAGGEVQDQNNVKTAQAFVKAAKAALKAGDWEEAAEQFDSASRLMEKSYAFLPNKDDYPQVLLQLGAAQLSAGDKSMGKETLKKAAILKADVALSDIGQAAAQAYAKAVAEVDKLPLGAVQLASLPTNAEVYVDGKYKGVTPVTVAGLRVGPHQVALYKDGYGRKGAQIVISPTDMVDEEIELEVARRKLLLDDLSKQLETEIAGLKGERPRGGEGVNQIANLLYSETAVVVKISGPTDEKQVEAFIFDTQSQILLKRVTKTIDWSYRNKKAAQDLVKELTSFNYAEALGGDVSEAPKGDDSIVSKWWFWTIIGVVVVGGTAGILVATLPGEAEPAFAKDGNGAIVLSF